MEHTFDLVSPGTYSRGCRPNPILLSVVSIVGSFLVKDVQPPVQLDHLHQVPTFKQYTGNLLALTGQTSQKQRL